MKTNHFTLLCICIIMTSCKLLNCAAKVEKHLPEENMELAKDNKPIDTAALIMQCIKKYDSINHNNLELVAPKAGDVTFIPDTTKLDSNWKYNGDTIIATMLESGEAHAAIPGFPKKIVNKPTIYKIYKDSTGNYIAKFFESLLLF
jgi:hypothetical protein